MKRHYIIYILSLILAFAGPAVVWAAQMDEPIETETQTVGIAFNGHNTLRITGAKGEVVHIYNLAGLLEATFRINSEDEVVRVSLRRGGYIVKVGTVTRKIAVVR